jgi:hypothetical protein
MNTADHFKHAGIVERLALGIIDHDVERVGASELGVELLACGDSLLA